MKKSIRSYLRTTALAAAATLSLPMTALAEEVQLHSHDGSTHMKGDLLRYQDGRYELDTALGVLLILARVVACEDDTCPSDTLVLSDMEAAGDLPFEQRAVISSLVSKPAGSCIAATSDC